MNIHQIFISDVSKPFDGFIKDKVNTLKSLYSDYTYTLYNKKSLRELIVNHFDYRVVRAFDTLAAYAHKGDLGKMCVLYVYGGYYFDLTICPSKKYEFKDDIVLVKGIAHKVHTLGRDVIENNFLYVKEPGHPLIKAVIDRIVDNVERLDHGIHPLDITAPIAVGRVFEKFGNIENASYGHVELYDNKDKYTTYKGEHFYDFKPVAYNADISKLGVEGTNRYDSLWFANKSFNINFSYVYNPIAQDKDSKIIEAKTIHSIQNNLAEGDEWVHDKAEASNNVIIYIKQNILLPNTFRETLLNHIYSFNHFKSIKLTTCLDTGELVDDGSLIAMNRLYSSTPQLVDTYVYKIKDFRSSVINEDRRTETRLLFKKL